MLEKIFVEKYNASDDSFEVTEIFFESGSLVKKGDLIFSVESSKADIDIECEFSGYIYHKISLDEKIFVGKLLYIISEKKLDDINSFFEEEDYNEPSDIIVSSKAMAILKKEGINPKDIGKSFIKESDVKNYIKNHNKPSDKKRLIKLQDKIKSFDSNKWVVILGAGGGAKMCIDAISQNKNFKILGLLDDKKTDDNFFFSHDIIGDFDFYETLIDLGIKNFILAFGVISNRKNRFNLYLKMKKNGANFINLIHPKAIVEDSVVMGEGNVILAGANVGSGVVMGDLNYINNSSIVSHDCILENNIHIAPGAVLASSIEIGSNSLIGMNSTIFYGIRIGNNVTINNGVNLNSDVDNGELIKNNF